LGEELMYVQMSR